MDWSPSTSWKYCHIYAHLTITEALFEVLGCKYKNAKGRGEKSIYHHLVGYAADGMQEYGGQLFQFNVDKFMTEFESRKNYLKKNRYDDTDINEYVDMIFKDFLNLFPVDRFFNFQLSAFPLECRLSMKNI